MKKTFIAIFFLISTWCYGQRPWHAVAVGSTGVLTSNPQKLIGKNNYSVIFPDGDTISAEEAKGIFAINLILTDDKQNLFRGKITEFKMTIVNKAGEISFDGNSEILSAEMKERLQKIQSGDKLFFEFIRAIMPDGTKPNIPTLGFTIR